MYSRYSRDIHVSISDVSFQHSVSQEMYVCEPVSSYTYCFDSRPLYQRPLQPETSTGAVPMSADVVHSGISFQTGCVFSYLLREVDIVTKLDN